MLASQLFRRVVTTGTLTVIDAGGRTHRYGDGGAPKVAIRLHDRALHHRLLTNPKLALGEAYMDGTLTLEEGDVYDLLDLAGRNLAAFEEHPLQAAQARMGRLLRFLHTHNPVKRARRNVAAKFTLMRMQRATLAVYDELLTTHFANRFEAYRTPFPL